MLKNTTTINIPKPGNSVKGSHPKNIAIALFSKLSS